MTTSHSKPTIELVDGEEYERIENKNLEEILARRDVVSEQLDKIKAEYKMLTEKAYQIASRNSLCGDYKITNYRNDDVYVADFEQYCVDNGIVVAPEKCVKGKLVRRISKREKGDKK